jgi:Transposase family tnp2
MVPGGLTKLDLHWVLKLIVDEINKLYTEGIRIWDAHTQSDFQCYARLLAVMSDYKGLEKGLNMKGYPSVHACLKCWMPAVSVSKEVRQALDLRVRVRMHGVPQTPVRCLACTLLIRCLF